jgi:sugar/nucleoside kinase (ribokinase family)
MRSVVLFAGDANADIILSGLARPPQEDREVFCDGFSAALGGSTTIAAAAYARLGGKAEFCGLVGGDEYGRLVRAELSRAGVGTRLLRVARGERTGVTVSIVRESSRTQITYPGCLSTVDESEAIRRSLRRFAHVHVSGIYGTPAFLPRSASILGEARSLGLSTSLDTQWDATETWACAEEWLPSVSYLFVNGDEARSLAGRLRGKPVAGYAEAWETLAARTACPIIKLGPDGAYAAGRAFAAHPVDVIDATGAGDTFAAAFLYATLEEGLNFEGAIALASAAGAVACGYEGGASPSLSLERVKRMLG